MLRRKLPAKEKYRDRSTVAHGEGSPPSAGGNPIPSGGIQWDVSGVESRGLIRIDLDLPLAGCSYEDYGEYPLHGSLALTALGQEALDDMEILG